MAQAVVIQEDGSRTRGQADEGDEEPIARRDLREIADMARKKHDDEHDERGEAISEEGGTDEGIVAQNLLGKHRRTTEGESRQQRQQCRINRGDALGAEIGERPAEGEEIAANEGDTGPKCKMSLDSLFQNDACQNDGKDGLQFLEQNHNRQAVEMQQKQRLDDGQSAQGTAKQGDEQEIDQVGARHGFQMTVFPEEEHVHQCEGAEVDDEDHEGRVEVVKLWREQDAVHAPKHGGQGHSQRPDEFCILLVVFHFSNLSLAVASFSQRTHMMMELMR